MRPSEGRDCLIYHMGGKNKAPSLFVIWDEEEEESSLIFGSKERSLHIAFKERKGSVGAGCSKRCALGRVLSRSWVTLSQAVQQSVAVVQGIHIPL